MSIFYVVTLLLVVFIICALFYYLVEDVTRKKDSDKEFKKSIHKQVAEVKSKKNKIRVLGTDFEDEKHAKK